METLKHDKKKLLGRIIAIDDSESALKSLKKNLSSQPFEIIEVSNPVEALGIIDKSIDLILLDISMPVISEFEFLEKFRKIKDFNNIPIIVLTDMEKNCEDIIKLFELGANDYIIKPYLDKELHSRINLHIKIKNLVDELLRSNKKLHEEFEENNKTVLVMMEYVSMLETELTEKFQKLKMGMTADELKDIFIKLKARLGYIKDEKEKEVLEMLRYKKELDKLNKIHSVVVMHDTEIEEEMKDKIKEVTHQAQTDLLTQINNRVKFYEVLYLEIEKFKNFRRNFSAIMFDIDYFKNINDVYGHDAGDLVLVALCKIVNRIISGKDTFARWGGEEFIILLPDKSLEEAKGLAENIRMTIEYSNFESINCLTCSFGVTQYSETDTEASVFLKRVDTALYKAKENGRNRVEIISQLPAAQN